KKYRSKHKDDRVNEFLRNSGSVQSFGVIFGCLRMGDKYHCIKSGTASSLGVENRVFIFWW
ncbi:MAG: hypothetical protein M3M88_03430, partial [Thermoproteota archaeon]|nr:hypothetical protein [Thermoproteota archaeon]